MSIPSDRKYSETHEWFLVEDDVVTIGITQYAADELTDITYVEVPEVGTSIAAGEPIGEVESVKATSEIISVISGEVVEANTALVDHPELINDGAYDDGWIAKVKADSLKPLEALMNAKDYEALISS